MAVSKISNPMCSVGPSPRREKRTPSRPDTSLHDLMKTFWGFGFFWGGGLGQSTKPLLPFHPLAENTLFLLSGAIKRAHKSPPMRVFVETIRDDVHCQGDITKPA